MGRRHGGSEWDGPVRVHGRWTLAASGPQWAVRPVSLRWSSAEWTTPPGPVRPSDVMLLGWTVEELRAIPVEDLVHPDDHDVLDDLAATPCRADFSTVSVRILARDSRYWWTRWWRARTSEPSCELHGVAYVRPDEWGRPVGTWRWRVEREAVSWSPDLLDMFDVRVGPPAGLADFLETVHEDDRDSAATTLRRAVAACDVFAYTFRCPTATGHDRWFYASGRCQLDDDGAHVVVGLVKYLNPPATACRPAAIGCG